MTNIQFPIVSTDELALDLTINAKGKITRATPKPLTAGPVLWYNADEEGRAKNSNEYGSRDNLYIYPAVEQGLTRRQLIDLGEEMTGHRFVKSACVECPFPSMDYLIDRAQREWEEFARTVVREMQVFRLNPRMHLYGFGTAYWVAKEHAPKALARAQDMWAERGPWRIMRMRRVVTQCPNPSKANPTKWRVDSSRCLNTLEVVTGYYAAAVDRLREYGDLNWIENTDLACVKYRVAPYWVKQLSPEVQRDRTLTGEDLRGEAYIGNRVGKANWSRFICNPFPVVEVKPRNILVTPRCEEWITITPHCVTDKVANADKFESIWEETLGQGAQFCLF